MSSRADSFKLLLLLTSGVRLTHLIIFLILLLILVLAGMVYQATGRALDARRCPPRVNG
jgi:hypothetical protein